MKRVSVILVGLFLCMGCLENLTNGDNTSNENVVSVAPTEENKPPYIGSQRDTLPKCSATVGTPYSDTLLYGDENSTDSVHCSLLSGPAGMTFEPKIISIPTPTGSIQGPGVVLNWTPGISDTGRVSVSAMAVDLGGLSDTVKWTITVSDTNHWPIFNSKPEDMLDSVHVGQEYRDTIRAFDPDGDSLRITKVKGPIRISDSIVSWTPTAYNIGTHVCSLVVEDGHSKYIGTNLDPNAGMHLPIYLTIRDTLVWNITVFFDTLPKIDVDSVAQASCSTLTLHWTACTSNTFKEYVIYRSLDPLVDAGFPDTLVASISKQTCDTLLDHSLSPATTYYYRVFVKDTFSVAVGGSVDSGRTLEAYVEIDTVESITTPQVEGNTVGIPAGNFTDNNGNVASVGKLYIDSTEVSFKMYLEYDSTFNAGGYSFDTLHPVFMVSWYNAILFCNWRSKKHSLDTCYTYVDICEGCANSRDTLVGLECDFSKNGFRLPTEDEWEYACKGGKGLQYGTADGSISCAQANYWGCTGAVKPICSHAPNPFGLYEMSGNLSEMCWDIYVAPDTNRVNSRKDYTGPTNYGNYPWRILRGGGFSSTEAAAKSSQRTGNPLANPLTMTGFRCVRSRD